MTTLTAEQRRIVEWDEGPAVVIADDLFDDWELARSGLPLRRIEPLR